MEIFLNHFSIEREKIFQQLGQLGPEGGLQKKKIGCQGYIELLSGNLLLSLFLLEARAKLPNRPCILDGKAVKNKESATS